VYKPKSIVWYVLVLSMPDAKDVAWNLISRVHAIATQPVKIFEMLEQCTPKPKKLYN
jgi:hypothetical protein